MPDLIITPPTADGNPEPTVTLELTRDGADVLGEVSNGRITNALPGAYSATWTAINGVSPNATVTRTATVEAPVVASLDYFAAPRNTNAWYSSATGPTAQYDAVSDTTFIAFQSYEPASPNRYTRVTSYNHTTKSWGKEIVVGWGDITDDDHGVPALCITENGYVSVFWGGHNGPMQFAIFNTPRSLSGGFTTQSVDGTYTYWRPHARAGGGIDVFMRRRDQADSKMPLVYRQIALTGSTPSVGAESVVVDFGSNSRFYGGDTFRGSDGRLWMIATRAPWNDDRRMDNFLLRIDPDAKVVLNLTGTSSAWPLGGAEMAGCRIYEHTSDSSITGNVPGMARDAAGRLHVTFNIGQAIGSGGTEDVSPQEVYHQIVTGTTVGAPFKVADMDQRYEASRVVPMSNGAIGIYYPSTEGVRGGGILRRVIPAGSVTPGAVETIRAYDPARGALNEIQVVQNAHPDFRVAFTEISPDDKDNVTAGHRIFAHGDSGYVTHPLPDYNAVLDAGALLALDMTDPANLAAQANNTGTVSGDLAPFLLIRDITGNGNHFTKVGSAGPGFFIDNDETNRFAQIGKEGSFSRESTAYRRSALNLVQSGAFSVTMMMAPVSTKGGSNDLWIISSDQGIGGTRSWALVYRVDLRGFKLIPRGFPDVLSASGLLRPSEYGVLTVFGTGSGCGVRLNGQQIIASTGVISSAQNELVLGCEGSLNSSRFLPGNWRRLVARSGAVSTAQMEADEAWVQALAPQA